MWPETFSSRRQVEPDDRVRKLEWPTPAASPGRVGGKTSSKQRRPPESHGYGTKAAPTSPEFPAKEAKQISKRHQRLGSPVGLFTDCGIDMCRFRVPAEYI